MKIYLTGGTDTDPIAPDIFGMAVVDPVISGLPYEIWVDPAASGRNVKHNSPRVKVVVNHQRIPFSVGDNPKCLVKNHPKIKDESAILSWLIQNKEVLLQWWGRELTDKQALSLLRPLK